MKKEIHNELNHKHQKELMERQLVFFFLNKYNNKH
jgi:hypothetical protein